MCAYKQGGGGQRFSHDLHDFSLFLGAMIFTKIPLSYENHLSTCQGWDFNKKIGTGSISLIGPSYTT